MSATSAAPTVRSLFDACAALAPAERERALASAEVDDATRTRVRDLLRAHDRAATPVDGLLAWAAPVIEATDRLPEAIGPYRVERLLGRGGMGSVYLATQVEPRRRVAVKRLHDALADGALARFRREAAVLAQLQHPGIAQIHEAGVARDGTPYLVMEYVDGVPLREQAKTLSRAARIALLARIADAIDHAHSRGVVHRDLKPTNILVTPDGAPKIVDFGIARSLDERHETLTATGVLLGTPAYMSPEQASGTHETVDARADVYALGVIGYELLANRLPLSVAGLAPIAALKLIAHETPPPLSRLDLTLRGDLETIFAKALEKEPDRRYATAAAFADDLRRHLAHEPIHARPTTFGYRVAKLARRNPALAASLACVALLLVGGIALASWLALGQRAERLRAEAALAAANVERERSDGTLAFVTRLIAEASPARSGRPDVAVKEVLERAIPEVEQRPLASQGPLWVVLGDALVGYGASSRAVPLYERAIDAYVAGGPADAASAAAVRLAAELIEIGRYDEARTRLIAQVDGAAALPPAVRARAIAQLARVELRLGRAERVPALERELAALPAIALQPGEVPPALIVADAWLEYHDDRVEDEALVARLPSVRAAAKTALGDTHPFALRVDRFDSVLAYRRRDDQASIAAARAYQARHVAVLGETHLATLDARAAYANALCNQGQFRQCDDLLAAVERDLARSLPSDSMRFLTLEMYRASARSMLGTQAETLARAPALVERACTAGTMYFDACTLLKFEIAAAAAEVGDRVTERRWRARLVEAISGSVGLDHVFLPNSLVRIGEAYVRAGDVEAAAEVADAAVAAFNAVRQGSARQLDPAAAGIGRLYVKLGEHARALPYVERGHLASHDPDAGLFHAPAARYHALALAALGRHDEALDALDESWADEMAKPVQLVDRMDLARTYVKAHDLAGNVAERERWTKVLVELVDAGAFLTPQDRETWAAIDAYRARRAE